jgi:predicted kinase
MKATILIGTSGSGKSTWARSQCAKVVSADNYFTGPDGVYRFDPRDLGKAHGACLNAYVDALRAGKDVIVDNTNTTLIEIAPYMALALATEGCEVEVRVFQIDPKVCASRNSHGVSMQTIEAMQARIIATLSNWPPFWPIPRIG